MKFAGVEKAQGCTFRGIARCHGGAACGGQRQHAVDVRRYVVRSISVVPYRDAVVPSQVRCDWTLQTYSVSNHLLKG